MTFSKRRSASVKRILTAVLLICFMLQSLAVSAAEVWTKDSKGYRYTAEEGQTVSNKWKLVDGKWYFIDANGYRVTGWKKVGGKWYYFNSDGIMQTGWITDSGKTYYLKEDGSMVTGDIEIDNVCYSFDASGALTGKKEEGSGSVVGSIITFGTYEQDANTSNGKEPIEWIILEEKDDKYFVLARYGLDVQRYNSKWKAVTWENSTLRAWLNDSFYNTAFSDEDKARIQTTRVSNTKNSKYGTAAGSDTSDKVFLLSLSEANKYFSANKERMCQPTAYADTKGAWHSEATSTKMNGWWFLRSPGGNPQHAAGVSTAGNVDTFGNHVNFTMASIRPAMWISK